MLIFVIQENEIFISVIRDRFFSFVNRARKPPVRPSNKWMKYFCFNTQEYIFNIHLLLAISHKIKYSGNERRKHLHWLWHHVVMYVAIREFNKTTKATPTPWSTSLNKRFKWAKRWLCTYVIILCTFLLPSYAKQQREIGPHWFCAVWRTWTTRANFSNLYSEFNSVFHNQFRALTVRNKLNDFRISQDL